MGEKTTLPKGYIGIIATEKKKTVSDFQERVLNVEDKFTEFTRWNLETKPSTNDAIIKAFDWLSVAHVLHESDSEDEMETEDSPTGTTER